MTAAGVVVKFVLLNVPLIPPLGGFRLVIDHVPPIVVVDVPAIEAPVNGIAAGVAELHTMSGPPASMVKVAPALTKMGPVRL